MKRLFRFMQGTGFVIAITGILAFDSSWWTGLCMMAAGGMLMYGFAKLENGYYFVPEGKRRGKWRQGNLCGKKAEEKL